MNGEDWSYDRQQKLRKQMFIEFQVSANEYLAECETLADKHKVLTGLLSALVCSVRFVFLLIPNERRDDMIDKMIRDMESFKTKQESN